MKKASIFLLALLIAASMTACGHPSSSDVQDNSTAAIQAYIDQLMQTEEMKETIEDCKANHMIHQLEARKDTFVYKYSYTVELPSNAKELLDSQYNNFKDSFALLADGIKAEEPAVKKVIWEYYSIDGDLIFGFSF